jgi:FAD-linked sulfhydryl oxidase
MPTNDASAVPPGMVLGPDGKPCKACTAFLSWPKVAKKKEGASSGPKGTALGGAGALAPIRDRSQCPPDIEQLGRATWTFLHTTAAYYPEQPTPTQKSHMLSLLTSLPTLYPCSHCASHLGQNLKEHPPDVSGRDRLSRWLCERHNDVNERLGKEKFDCNKTLERWKDGPSDGSCD